MKSPEIKVRSTWRLLIDAGIHFMRNLGCFLAFSIIPLVLFYLGTIYGIVYTSSFLIIFVALPIFILVHGLTTLTSWETMWGANPDFGLMVNYLIRSLGRITITWLLYSTAVVTIPVLLILFSYRVFQFIAETRNTGVIPSIILILLALFGIAMLLTAFPEITGFGIELLLLTVFLIIFLLPILYIMLMLVVPIALLQRRSPLLAFTCSIKLTWGYWLHALPFVILEILALLVAAIAGTVLSPLFTESFSLPPEQLTLAVAGLFYVIAIPFLINIRVFYFQDYTLRKHGYDMLLRTRYMCNCVGQKNYSKINI